MIIQPFYTMPAASVPTNPQSGRQAPAAEAAGFADNITLSQKAYDALKSAQQRTTSTVGDSGWAARMDELIANDDRFAQIRAKQNSGIGVTSEELEYVANKSGLPNTMAFLSPGERGLFDRLVARKNQDAANGLHAIAHIRSGGIIGAGADMNYDPNSTPITAQNIKEYFMGSINDPSGVTKGQLQALINHLQSDPSATEEV